MISFLQALLPPEGYICVAEALEKGFRHHWCDDTEMAERKATQLDAAGKTVFVAMASFRTTDSRKGENAHQLRTFFMDVDCSPDGTKPYLSQLEGLQAIFRFCKEASLPRPTVINSGNGLYSFWTLTKAIPAALWLGVAGLLQKLVKEIEPGLDKDGLIADRARVLRPVGSHNRKKGGCKEVKLLRDAEPLPPMGFIKALKLAAATVKVALPVTKATVTANTEFLTGLGGDFQPSSAEAIALKCGQVAAFAACKGDVPEPLWWSMIGMLRYTTEGREIIHEWSSGHHGYSPEGTDKKIEQHIKAGAGPTTCDHFRRINPVGCDGCTGTVKSPITLGREAVIPDYVEKLNWDHFVTQEGGRTVVCREIRNEGHRAELIRSSFTDFKNFHSHTKVSIGTGSDGNPICRPLGLAWTSHLHRRQYDGIIMSPLKEVANYYNLWQGFAVQPVRGSWELMKQHLFEVICSENKEAFQYLMGWMATMIQQPGQPGEVAIVLQGGRGTGKGMFGNALCRIMGQHAWQVTNGKHVTGNFNAHLEDCIFLFADEAFWAGDKQAENVLKGLITEPTIPIERKGVDLKTVSNMLHVLMASNSDWVVPAGMDERRYCVLKVSNRFAQNHQYFKRLMSELGSGGLEAMLYDLQAHDISRFNVRAVPMTHGLAEQKEQSLDSVSAWWLQKLIDGELTPYATVWGVVPFQALYEDYQESARGVSSTTRRADVATFGKMLKKVLPSGWPKTPRLNLPGVVKRAKHYELPPLETCRACWDSHIGCKREWESPS